MLVSGLEQAKITLWASTYPPSSQARGTSQKSPSSHEFPNTILMFFLDWLAVTDAFDLNLLGSTILIMSLLLGCPLGRSQTSPTYSGCWYQPALPPPSPPACGQSFVPVCVVIGEISSTSSGHNCFQPLGSASSQFIPDNNSLFSFQKAV